MRNFKLLTTVAVFALTVFVLQGCSFSTANMSSLKTSKDKDGKTETTSYKGGDTIYAKAAIANNPGKVKVKYTLLDPSGKAVPNADVSVDIDGDGVATYSLPTADSMSGGYKLTADMINENGEKKDGKTAALTFVAGAPLASTAPSSSDDEEK